MAPAARKEARMADTKKPKRGPGRPRKHPPADPNAPKRPRGRPRMSAEEKAEAQARRAEAKAEAAGTAAEEAQRAQAKAETAAANAVLAVEDQPLPEFMMSSPLDQALKNRRVARQRDPRLQQERQIRVVDAPPVDFMPRPESEGDTPADAIARQAMTGLYKMWAAIKDAAGNLSEVNLNDLSKLSERGLTKALTKCDSAMSKLQTMETALESKIEELIKPPVSDVFASEIRANIQARLTDSAGRTKSGGLDKIMHLVREDKRVSAAVLGAPAMLSGLDAKAQNLIRQISIDHYAVQTKSELERCRRARDLLERATQRSIEKLAPKLRAWAPPDSSEMKTLRELVGS